MIDWTKPIETRDGVPLKVLDHDVGDDTYELCAPHDKLDLGGITDIASDEFDIRRDLRESARASARIVIEHAHAMTGLNQRLDEA